MIRCICEEKVTYYYNRHGWCMDWNIDLIELKNLADEYCEEGKKAYADDKLEEAVSLIENAVHLYSKTGSNYEKVLSLNLLGIIYGTLGNGDLEIDYYLEGLQLACDKNMYSVLVLFYNNIGASYHVVNNSKKALEYFLKAEETLEYEECKAEERYPLWAMATYLNVADAYCSIGELSHAYDYIEKSKLYEEYEINSYNKYPLLITSCKYLIKNNQSDKVNCHIDELLDGIVQDVEASDHIKNIIDLCDLFRAMKAYDSWRKAIIEFEKFVSRHKTVYFQFIVVGMWMDYYEETGVEDKYIECCIKHAKLYKEYQEIVNSEKSRSIDLKIELQRKESAWKNAQEQSLKDALTGVGNRMKLKRDFIKILCKDSKQDKAITFGIMDIDHFKSLNDTLGHVMGDKCLCTIAKKIDELIKGIGNVYRFGGDEFVVIFKDVSLDEVDEFALKLKSEIFSSVDETNITLSQGYVHLVPKSTDSLELILNEADKALYEIKQNGRNGYCIKCHK